MKIHYLILAFLVLTTSCTSREQKVDKSKLLGNDYRLFQDTPAWDLAKAVEDENTELIKKIIKEGEVDVNYREFRFGQPLIMLAVINEQYASCKMLLELGANPNLHDKNDGSNAMIEAAKIDNSNVDKMKFMGLLLKFKGDPNSVEVGPRRVGNTTRNSVLIAAVDADEIYSSLPIVKLLVKAGANINYENEFGQTAFNEAIVLEIYDVALYLLQNGADYNKVIIDRSQFSKDGKKVYLVEILREFTPKLGSKKHLKKRAIIQLLKQKGIDYQKVPIPDFVLERIKKKYPNGWKEYIEKY
jgi:ankyrin repeat protein